MIRNTAKFLLTASLMLGANCFLFPHKMPDAHSQVVSIPTDGLEVNEMLLIADKSHSLLFLNNPTMKAVKIMQVTDTLRPVELKSFRYETDGQTHPFHLIEHASELIEFASAGRYSIRHPHTI